MGGARCCWLRQCRKWSIRMEAVGVRCDQLQGTAQDGMCATAVLQQRSSAAVSQQMVIVECQRRTIWVCRCTAPNACGGAKQWASSASLNSGCWGYRSCR